MCRICEREEETMEHLTGGCEGEEKERGVTEFLGDAGEGLEETKRIIRERKRREEERRRSGGRVTRSSQRENQS